MSINPVHFRFIKIVLLSALSLSACASAESAPPSVTFVPKVVFVTQPTSAPATAANVAATSVEPATAVANVTDAPVAIAPATAATTPQEAPGLAPGANPYTGLPVPAEVSARKPVLIKVANTVEVRPQSGLNSADVVVEHLSEGSITRFTALFLTNAPKKVGSVRSCRLIDLELPVIFDAALVCSGTSPGVKQLMRNSYAHKNNLTMISDFGPYECGQCPMFRTSDRSAPHNLFANAGNAWKELDKRGKNQPSTFASWVFSAQAGPEGKPTNAVEVGYKSGLVSWSYDGASGAWQRALSGKKQIDASTGQPISFTNVIVAYANHVTTLIQEDVTGAKSIEVQFWGEGPVRIFRDGREYGGKWKRNAEVGNLEFFDPAGNKLPLKPGNSWIEMVPLSGVDVGTR